MADSYMAPLAKRFSGYSPDTLSWLAFASAVPAGFLFWAAGAWNYRILLLATVAIFLNAGFDALDGWVARLTGRASRRGDFLDHVLDRYADAFIIGGIAFSAFCHLWVGLLGLLGVLFTSYMGTQAQALGLRRDYGGILGRADRMAMLFFVPLLQWLWTGITHDLAVVTITMGGTRYGITLLEMLVIWFAVAGNATALQRALRSWRELSEGMGTKAGAGEAGAPVPEKEPTAPAPVPADTPAPVSVPETAPASAEGGSGGPPR
jgi:archaetidylinositol phosphate synthase